MSMNTPTLITASALGALLTLGTITPASAGKGGCDNMTQNDNGATYGLYRGYKLPGGYVHGVHSGSPAMRYMSHPVYNYSSSGNSGYILKTSMHEAGSEKAATPQGDIVTVAVGAGDFNTLVAAIKAAGLVETLQGPGPFTVFAPTDEAFAKIPKADLDALLADKDKLTAVLTYHVVPGKVIAADVVKLKSAKTVQGESVTIDASDGVKVDGANVVKTDISASNGVIHVIDTVIMPK